MYVVAKPDSVPLYAAPVVPPVQPVQLAAMLVLDDTAAASTWKVRAAARLALLVPVMAPRYIFSVPASEPVDSTVMHLNPLTPGLIAGLGEQVGGGVGVRRAAAVVLQLELAGGPGVSRCCWWWR